MANSPKNRTHWKREHGPARDSTGSRTLAVFFDAADTNRRAEVSIATRTLGQIGNRLSDPHEGEQRAVKVLTAMLEEFEGEVECGRLIKIDETVVDMITVNRRFAQE